MKKKKSDKGAYSSFPTGADDESTSKKTDSVYEKTSLKSKSSGYMNFTEFQSSSEEESDKKRKKAPVESIYSYTSENSIPEKETRPKLSSARDVRTESVYSYTGEISQEIKNASITRDSAQNRKESAYSTTTDNFEKKQSSFRDEKKKSFKDENPEPVITKKRSKKNIEDIYSSTPPSISKVDLDQVSTPVSDTKIKQEERPLIKEPKKIEIKVQQEDPYSATPSPKSKIQQEDSYSATPSPKSKIQQEDPYLATPRSREKKKKK